MFPIVTSRRALVIASVITTMCMVAVEATIVSTAMPQIVAQLGGLRFYSWVFSSYLLAQTATTVVFGNLADLYGRKPVMLAGIVIFLSGSLLAGFAGSMVSMIVYRVIQGIGAGAMQTVAMTIVADLYPARERGKIQGYLASIWAVAAVLGPILGGIIIRDVSWSWVFWINLPFGFIAAAGFIAFLHEEAKHERIPIDLVGAMTFTLAVTSLLIALTEIGSGHPDILYGATGVLCFSIAAFVIQERRASNPLVSFALWSRRPIAATNGVCLLAGMALIGLTTFVPIYVQLVLQRSPVVAGLALTTMLLGWPIGATSAAKLFHRVGLHQLLRTGALLMPMGATFLVVLSPRSSPIIAGLGSLVMGLGMGVLSVSALVLVQEIVDRSQRGSATASNLFSRNLGSTLGATFLGAVLNQGLARSMGGNGVTSDQLRRLLDAPAVTSVADAAIRLAMQHSLNLTFWAMLILSMLAVSVALFVPSVPLRPVKDMPDLPDMPLE